MEAPHNSSRCCYGPIYKFMAIFKPLELLLATVKSYRLNCTGQDQVLIYTQIVVL